MSVVTLDGRHRGGRGQPGEVGIDVHALRRVSGTLRDLAQAVVARPVRDCDPDPAVPDRADGDIGVLDERRLVQRGRGEACKPGPFGVHERLGLVG